MPAPVILLAFANDQDDHLPLLQKEAEAIHTELQRHQEEHNWQLLRLENANIEELSRQIRRHRDRIAVFHFGGHADSTRLLLRDGQAAPGGLAKLLTGGSAGQLQLVVLNGCSTQEQVQAFLEGGVGAVVATSVPVADEMAVDFSITFYEQLVSGDTVQQAFETAMAYLQTKYDRAPDSKILTVRGFGREWKEQPYLPWALYTRADHSQGLRWKLPTRRSRRWWPVAGLALVALLAAGSYLLDPSWFAGKTERDSSTVPDSLVLQNDPPITDVTTIDDEQEPPPLATTSQPPASGPDETSPKEPLPITYYFSGTVSAANDQQGLAGVTILINGQSMGQTGEAGRFDLSHQLERSRDIINVRFQRAGYVGFSKDIELPAAKKDGSRIDIGHILLETK